MKQKISPPKKIHQQIHPQNENPEWYSVNGMKYLREDLVNKRDGIIIERIAKVLEVQADFYKKWDKHIEIIFKMTKKMYKEYGK